MTLIKLYKIRNVVRGLTPLYISIYAALLLNITTDCSPALYFLGLISFIIACVISNELSSRCNNYGRIYDIEYSINKTIKKINNNETVQTNNTQKRETIYNEYENKLNKNKRCFQYWGVFLFGVLGLFFVIFSYLPLNNQSQKYANQNVNLQRQVDSLKIINNEQALQILELKQVNDSILKSNIDIFKSQNKQQSESNSVENQNKIKTAK